MKIALLGYGRMGKAIEKFALDRGHQITFIQDKDKYSGKIKGAD
ncbi:MAG: NAD(P)-binding domain-containing protein, partial [Flavobacteriaceae bacterium]